MVGRLSSREDFAGRCCGDGVGRFRRACVGCPGLRGGRAAAFTPHRQALLSLKYDVSLGAAVSDASRGEASRRPVGARGRARGEPSEQSQNPTNFSSYILARGE